MRKDNFGMYCIAEIVGEMSIQAVAGFISSVYEKKSRFRKRWGGKSLFLDTHPLKTPRTKFSMKNDPRTINGIK